MPTSDRLTSGITVQCPVCLSSSLVVKDFTAGAPSEDLSRAITYRAVCSECGIDLSRRDTEPVNVEEFAIHFVTADIRLRANR